IMALVTTFMTTPLLEIVYPASELARQLDTPLPMPASSTNSVFTVLMCVAFDRSGPAMVTLASALVADRPDHNRLYALRLIRPTDRASFYIIDQDEETGMQGLKPLLQKAEQLPLSVNPISFLPPRPAQDICNVAEVKGANLIVLGWHKPVVTRTVLGGTVADVLEK